MTKIVLATLLMIMGVFGVTAQLMPAGASDRNLDDRGVKDRSIELEKVKRDADKADPSKSGPAAQLRFAEIKEDFEKMQMMQNRIIQIYTRSKIINFQIIAESADGIVKSGTRLEGNLFTIVEDPKAKKKKEKKKKEAPKTDDAATPVVTEKPLPTDLKMLIVEIDNTLAAFIANPMFTNPQIVNAAENARAKADLERLIKLSSALKAEAEKQKQ